MKRRLFRFSLQSLMLVMIGAALGLGVYTRWPYHVAGEVLDRADGDKSFAAWPAVRDALVNSKSFRERAPQLRRLVVNAPIELVRANVVRKSVNISTGAFSSWQVFYSSDGNSWSVEEVFSKDWSADMKF